MNGFKFFWEVIISLLWPPKGIIYLEEQMLQWVLAIGKVWFKYHMPEIIIAVTIYLLVMYVVFERTHCHHGGRTIHRVMGFLGRIFLNIALAWAMLIYGALRGEVAGNRGEGNARVTTTATLHRSRLWAVTQSFTRLSLHFRLGRAIYRLVYRVLGFIPYMNNNDRVRHIVARIVAMIIIVWGAWNIPYDLTHWANSGWR